MSSTIYLRSLTASGLVIMPRCSSRGNFWSRPSRLLRTGYCHRCYLVATIVTVVLKCYVLATDSAQHSTNVTCLPQMLPVWFATNVTCLHQMLLGCLKSIIVPFEQITKLAAHSQTIVRGFRRAMRVVLDKIDKIAVTRRSHYEKFHTNIFIIMKNYEINFMKFWFLKHRGGCTGELSAGAAKDEKKTREMLIKRLWSGLWVTLSQ